MLKRVISGLVLAAAIFLSYVGYNRWKQGREMMSGVVRRGPADSSGLAASVAPIDPPDDDQRSTIHVGSPPPPGAATTSSSTAVPAGAPGTDSMSPNPPNGMAYSGSGRFQVYRQGNLTYRINTDTGQSCVLYATNEEWRKPQVYKHGCGSSAAR